MENKINPITNAINTLTNEENRSNIINQTKLIISQNEALQKCDANSVVLGIINLSNMGLDLSNTTNEAYLIPYGSKAQIQISYKGFEKLAYQTGKVKLIKCETIYNLDYLKKEDNIYVYDEPKEQIFNDNKEAIGYIATIVFSDGVTFQEKMSIKEMKDFKKEYSKGNI
jgi:recombination protein RecT